MVQHPATDAHDASGARTDADDGAEKPVVIHYRPPSRTLIQAFAGHPLAFIAATLAATLDRPADQLAATDPADDEGPARGPRCWIAHTGAAVPIAQVRGFAADQINRALADLAGAHQTEGKAA